MVNHHKCATLITTLVHIYKLEKLAYPKVKIREYPWVGPTLPMRIFSKEVARFDSMLFQFIPMVHHMDGGMFVM